MDFAVARKWPEAIALLQKILRDDPEMADVWSQLAVFAMRLDRYDLALDAYHRYGELKPQEPAAHLGAAAACSGCASWTRRATTRLWRGRRGCHDPRAGISARDAGADCARQARCRNGPCRSRAGARGRAVAAPPDYVEGRILYDQGKDKDALPFRESVGRREEAGAAPIAELHFYAADTLARFERYPEAEAEFEQELRVFPQNTRARGGLAMLYQADGRPSDAERALTDMIRVVPTPDSYALAARLFTMFGNRPQAEAVRAEAKRMFAGAHPHRAAGARSNRP